MRKSEGKGIEREGEGGNSKERKEGRAAPGGSEGWRKGGRDGGRDQIEGGREGLNGGRLSVRRREPVREGCVVSFKINPCQTELPYWK